MPISSGRLLYLDGMRGLAAFSVAILYHYSHFSDQFQPNSAPLADAPSFDWFGFHAIYIHGLVAVDIFFMISGYVFSHVYAADIAAKKVSGYRFFVRRFARLYPIHFVTLLITSILIFAFLHQTGHFPVYIYNGPLEFVLNVLFIQDSTLERGASFNGPAWSLSIEAMAYVLFFLMAAHGNPSRWAWVALAVGLALLLPGVSHTWRPMLISINVARGLIGFFLGLLIDRIGRLRPVAMTMAIIAVGALPLLVAPANGEYAWTWILFGGVLLALQRWPRLRRPLELRAVVVLGDLSLAVYLVHFPVQVIILLILQQMAVSIPFASPIFLVAYGLTVLAVAWGVHYRFELPVQLLLRRRLAA